MNGSLKKQTTCFTGYKIITLSRSGSTLYPLRNSLLLRLEATTYEYVWSTSSPNGSCARLRLLQFYSPLFELHSHLFDCNSAAPIHQLSERWRAAPMERVQKLLQRNDKGSLHMLKLYKWFGSSRLNMNSLSRHKKVWRGSIVSAFDLQVHAGVHELRKAGTDFLLLCRQWYDLSGHDCSAQEMIGRFGLLPG